MVLAAAHECEVERRRLEPVELQEIGQRFQVSDGEINRPVADLANQVMVGRLIAEMDHAGAMSQMYMVSDTGTLQSIDGPIYRRLVGATSRSFGHPLCYLGNGEVTVGVSRQDLTHVAPGGSDPHPGSS